MKFGNIPTYESYIYRYINFKNIGENKYFEFCKSVCTCIKRYIKEVDKYCNDDELLMNIAYQVYEHHYISNYEF